MTDTEIPSSGEPSVRTGGTMAAAYQYGSDMITSQAIAPLLAAARIAPGVRILDVACGTGHAVAAAVGAGAVGWGIDISAIKVAEAARRYPDIAFQEADASNLPFADESFHAVICNFGMPHFQDPDGFLREAFRLLGPGGVIAFTAWIDPGRQEQLEPDDMAIPSSDFFRFGEDAQCRSALGKAGFKAIEIQSARVAWRPPATDALIEIVMQGIARAATIVEAETVESQMAIRDALRSGIEADASGGAFELVMPALVASAQKGETA